MLRIIAACVSALLLSATALAADVSYRKDILPLWQANLKLFKAWVGEDTWILKCWEKRGEVPAITREELGRIRAKY